MSIETEQQAKQDGVTLAREGVLVPAESDVVPAISVVLPTMNEEAGIEECITRIKNALRAAKLRGEIIVSDDSHDRTPHIARSLGARIVEPDQRGYGYAYRYAFQFARGDLIVMGDADTTYDFEELPKLLQCMESTGADIVLGSRLEGEIKPGAMPPLHQYIGNPLLTGFLNVFYDAGVSDAHSGFRVFTRGALDMLELQTTGMEFASEMIMDASAKELQIEEVPITYHERSGEATLDSFQDGWRHIKFMLMNAPGYLFTGPGLLLGLMGVTLMLVSFLNTRIAGVFFGSHTVILGSLLTILGYQIGSLAVFSGIATNPIRNPQDPFTRFIQNRFQLKYGASVGVCVFATGGLFTTALAWQWVQSGFADPPFLVSLMVAVTVVILGVQTVFYSIFMSMLHQ